MEDDKKPKLKLPKLKKAQLKMRAKDRVLKLYSEACCEDYGYDNKGEL